MDPISNMISALKNGFMTHQSIVSIPFSKLKENIAKILKEEGFLANYKKTIKKKKEFLELRLKYRDEKPIISEIKRISKPGRRFYINQKEIPKLTKGFGFLILSTSKGVMTDKKARKSGLGGEVICKIW